MCILNRITSIHASWFKLCSSPPHPPVDLWTLPLPTLSYISFFIFLEYVNPISTLRSLYRNFFSLHLSMADSSLPFSSQFEHLLHRKSSPGHLIWGMQMFSDKGPDSEACKLCGPRDNAFSVLSNCSHGKTNDLFFCFLSLDVKTLFSSWAIQRQDGRQDFSQTIVCLISDLI